MDSRQSVRDLILAAVPGLRAYAVALSGSRDRADDLVQETLARALRHITTFQPGTNLHGWLTVILRNYFISEHRRRREWRRPRCRPPLSPAEPGGLDGAL